MGKSCSVVVASRCQENLGFMLKTSESVTVDNSVSVSLISSTDFALLFFYFPTLCVDTKHTVRRNGPLFVLESFKSYYVHLYTFFVFKYFSTFFIQKKSDFSPKNFEKNQIFEYSSFIISALYLPLLWSNISALSFSKSSPGILNVIVTSSANSVSRIIPPKEHIRG